MKVEVTALREFPYSEDGQEIRRIRKDDKLEVNLTTARAWRESGKVSFVDPKQEPEKAAPAKG